MKMVLLHDVIEIDAGDTYCYDTEGYKSKAEREEKAARRIFGLLPDDQRDEFYALWREFEDSETADARFAAVLDRIQPLMLNYTKGGISWQEHGIAKEQVLNRNKEYFSSSDKLADVIKSVINDAHEKGWLK
jgi:putative hydrolase of HD superfamily